MSADTRQVHLHIDNSTALGEIFEITHERFDAAVARHPAIAANLKVTFGRDGAGFEEAMSSADAQAQLDPGIRFFFGGQASSEPEREPGSRQ